MAMPLLNYKTICNICYNKVIDKGVECDDQCKRWFHPGCVGVTASGYKKIVKGLVKAWKCGRVDCTIPLNDPVDDLNDKMSNLLNNFSELAT